MFRFTRAVFGIAFILAFSLTGARALAATVAGLTIQGTVVDAATGLPLSGATLGIAGTKRTTTSDAHGAFGFDGLSNGFYRIVATRQGYQPTQSDLITVILGSEAHVTVAMQTAPTAQNLKLIGSTSTTTSGLQKTSVTYRDLSAESLQQTGTNRVGDALRQLPAINNSITGDTAALGDDLPLDIRGIGSLETTTTLDGHPIALGFPGGYNFQLSPAAPLRNVDVVYGSGSNLYGVSAIGGIVNFQTLQPTTDRRFNVSQGWGTFDKSATLLQATGTVQKFGYAVAYGVAGLDGPFKNEYFYQPGAAFDQSATDPAVRNLAIYKDDSSAVSFSGLAKLNYRLSPVTNVTFATVASSYWEDKTGNGDGDYLAYAPALAFGEQQLASYEKNAPSSAPCPLGSGTFPAYNANGAPNGTGPNGQPDGGTLCQTPKQWATYNTGLDGAGPAWQSFNFNDYNLSFSSTPRNQLIQANVFTNRYFNTINRYYQLPFVSSPGDNGFIANFNEAVSGYTVSDDVSLKHNVVGAGFSWNNLAYNLAFHTPGGSGVGAPTVSESTIFIRDRYRAPTLPLTVFADAGFVHATATNSSYIDPRASAVYLVTPRDVLRLSAGATTTEPSGDQLDQPFVPQLPGGAGGGAPITCDGLNSIGTAPSSVLQPERGVDEEVGFGHSFFGDTQAQFVYYSTEVYNKLYSTIEPINGNPGYISPEFLSEATAAVAGKCGAAAAPGLLGVNGNFNVGQLHAQGMLLSGRARFDRKTFLDFDWTLDSTALVSAPVALLQANPTLILGSQLPHLPLHTASVALDHVFFHGIDARITLHTVSVNNTKSLPAYDFSDLRVGAPAGPGVFTVSVTNLFNQYAFIQGYRYEGVPLPLNRYAGPGSSAPYVGASATEMFGLPYRMIYFNYSLQSR